MQARDIADPTSPAGIRRIGAACLALALVLRLAYLGAVTPQQETPGLSRKYQACAQHLLAGDGFFLQAGAAPVPYVDRLPGYVVLVAALLALGAGHAPVLLFAHAALGSLQALLASLAGGRLAGRKGAWAAGLLVATWPPLWKSDLQLVETGVSGAAITALVALALGAGPRRPGLRGLAFALLSLACVLLRPDYLPVPLLVAAWLLFERGRRSLPAVALTLALPAIAGASWAMRNARVADGAFLSVGLGTNLLAAIGESVPTADPSFGDRDVAQSEGHAGLYWPNPATRDRARVRRAIALIREHPGGYLKGCVRRIAVTLSMHPGRLWPGPAAETEIAAWRAAHPGRARYDGLFRAVAAHVAAHPLHALATFAWAPLALGLAAAGAWRLRRRRAALVALLALPAFAVLVHVPLHAEPRYFLPFLPALLILGSAALVRPRPQAEATALRDGRGLEA